MKKGLHRENSFRYSVLKIALPLHLSTFILAEDDFYKRKHKIILNVSNVSKSNVIV